VKLGLYFYSQEYEQIVDLEILTPDMCSQYTRCLVNQDQSVTFLIDRAWYLVINVIPAYEGDMMGARISYRLLNKQ